MNILKTQQLLERLAGLLRSESRAQLTQYGLQPIQFEALHYLSQCNRYSDTPMAVTEYLGQTKGTVSQTLKVLEKKGLLHKKADLDDKRVTRLEITEQGRQVVDEVLPSPVLQQAGLFLQGNELAATNRSLESLLIHLQQANRFKSFGQCVSCIHNLKTSANQYLCGLTQESLSQDETLLICREHDTKHELHASP